MFAASHKRVLPGFGLSLGTSLLFTCLILLLPMSALTLLIVWRHRGNLRDLFAGRERHF